MLYSKENNLDKTLSLHSRNFLVIDFAGLSLYLNGKSTIDRDVKIQVPEVLVDFRLSLPQEPAPRPSVQRERDGREAQPGRRPVVLTSGARSRVLHTWRAVLTVARPLR